MNCGFDVRVDEIKFDYILFAYCLFDRKRFTSLSVGCLYLSSSRRRRGTERRPHRPPVRSNGGPFLSRSQTPGGCTNDAESSKPLPQSHNLIRPIAHATCAQTTEK